MKQCSRLLFMIVCLGSCLLLEDRATSQDEESQLSFVTEAKATSALTGRPILAVAGSST